jgi:predicted DCC family thiol-disulfide oxidoreductase YuxK
MANVVSSNEPTALPRPEQRPSADVLIFDGDCGICRAQISRLARWDRKHRLAFLSLHDPETARRYGDLSHDDLMQNMVLVDQAGRRHRGAEAFRVLSRRVPRLWWLSPLLHLPGSMPLWQWAYRQIAKRRYRLSAATCNDGNCQVHAQK